MVVLPTWQVGGRWAHVEIALIAVRAELELSPLLPKCYPKLRMYLACRMSMPG